MSLEADGAVAVFERDLQRRDGTCTGGAVWTTGEGSVGEYGVLIETSLGAPVKSTQAKAKQALHGIWQAETKADAEKAFDLFLKTYEPKTLPMPNGRLSSLCFPNCPSEPTVVAVLGEIPGKC